MNSSAGLTRRLLYRGQVVESNLFKTLMQCSRTVSLCLYSGAYSNQHLLHSSFPSPPFSSAMSQSYHSCPTHSKVSTHSLIFDRQLRSVMSSATNTSYSVGRKGHCMSRCQYTSLAKPTQSNNKPPTDTRTTSKGSQTTSKELQSEPKGRFQLVYAAPLKGAIRAIKIFSLSTATAAVFGGPLLVWMGNPSVPLSGRIIMSSLVMLVGISTTALLHWLVKGYVIRMYFNEQTKTVQVYTLSVFGRKKLHQFNISEAGPPSSAAAFSSFQACGKSYFLHAEVFKDRKILSGLLGAYSEFETADTQTTDM